MFIKVKVHAGQKRAKLVQKKPDTFEIWTVAPAEQGRANDEARQTLAAHLGCEAKKLFLIKGATMPSKIFELKE